MNPIKPITRIPIAETFAIVLNSCIVGFLKICQTLTHFAKNDDNAVPIAMMKIEEYSLEVLESWMDDYDKWGEFYEWLKENLK